MGTVCDRDTLAPLVAARQQAGAVGVFTNGCFDLLHLGHVRYLQMARGLGDFLIVALNSDASTRRLKGPTRPLVPERERAEVLAALACVDYVTIFDEDTVEASLAALRPAIFVKGGDYGTGNPSPTRRGEGLALTPRPRLALGEGEPDAGNRELSAAEVRAMLAAPAGQSRAITAFAREASIVTEAGGRVALISYLPGHSTTELVRRIVAAYGEAVSDRDG
ncbi:MAG TPA: adenylyltransferase/cytidyltransferase family protein [Ktedonobacterales bacterium]|nr:adenylyltransferase/cytidyltransferase family protein [Ktedonobacterales bacterium]